MHEREVGREGKGLSRDVICDFSWIQTKYTRYSLAICGIWRHHTPKEKKEAKLA